MGEAESGCYSRSDRNHHLTSLPPAQVLTAAHCNAGWLGSLSVVAGLHDINEQNQIDNQKSSSNLQILNAKRVHIHPEFSRMQLANDIALIELETEAHYNENVQPVCMPPKR